MNAAEIERQLRERLTNHRTRSGIFDLPLSKIELESLVASLVPWILELVEEREWMAGNLTERLP